MIHWSKANDLPALSRYYQQRLGTNFQMLPCVMDRTLLMVHFTGNSEDGVLGRMPGVPIRRQHGQ